MRTLFLAKTFVRAHKRAVKKNPSLRGDIEATLRLLKESPICVSCLTLFGARAREKTTFY